MVPAKRTIICIGNSMKSKKRSLFQLIYLVSNVSWIQFAMMAISAIMAISQGYQQQKIANANAARLRLQAQQERANAERQAKILAKARQRERARATVAFVSSGVWIDEGSPLIVEAEDDYLSEQDQATAIAGGYAKAHHTGSQAMIQQAKGRAAVSAGYGRAAGALTSESGWKSGASLLEA